MAASTGGCRLALILRITYRLHRNNHGPLPLVRDAWSGDRPSVGAASTLTVHCARLRATDVNNNGRNRETTGPTWERFMKPSATSRVRLA